MSIGKLTKLFQEPQGSQQHFRRYLWLTLGPVLMMMTLVIFLSKHSLSLALLSLITCFSLPFIWRFQLKAALYGVGCLFASFLFIYTVHASPYLLLWVFLWCLALSASLVITALCAKEFSLEEDQVKEEKDKQLLQAESDYQSMQKQFEEQCDHHEEERKSLEKEVQYFEKELASFKQLMIACKEEADQYYMRSEHLNEENLHLQKTLGAFEGENFKSKQLELKNKELLKQLNEARVEAYQHKLLATRASPEIKESYNEQSQQQEKQLSQELEELEIERVQLKKIYQQHFREYQALSDQLQTFFTLDELHHYKSSEEDNFERAYQQIRTAFQEKGCQLQDMRIEIFKIEGAILQVKKTLKVSTEEGMSPGSYLAVADQECLRLEEENALLLNLLNQTLPLLERKVEHPQFKEPLESHNHFE